MKLIILLVTSAILVICNGKLPTPERPYKVLMLLPFASKSHRNVFLPIAKGLADRGHKVVMISPLPPATKHGNIEEINHGVQTHNPSGENMFEVRKNHSSGGFGLFKIYLPKIAKELYKVPSVQKIYADRHKYDVILVDSLFNELAYPFTYERPFILVSTAGKMSTWSSMMGNVYNPAYIPFFSDYPRPYSLISRVKNMFSVIGFSLMWRNDIIPLVQTEIDKHFPHLPPLLELERNVSLVLMNSHFSLDLASPNLPSQIEVGAMHCRPADALSNDLTEWINGAGPEGVVYFSLGSVTKGDFMPNEYKDIFLKAFAKLKQRVIWKFESEIPNKPSNVMVQSWLPQQDILANPNVKLFITHGGGLSCQEAIYHTTPLLALPIFGDQPRNGASLQNNGYGLSLLWEELTVDLVVKSIEEIVYNPKYQRNVEVASKTLKDQPMLPKDLAVWWTEYVIRHKGAAALRSPAADISWIEYLMLDVILLLHVVVFAVYWIIKKTLTYFFCSKRSKKQKLQ